MLDNYELAAISQELADAVLDRDGSRCRHSGATQDIGVYYIDPTKPTVRNDKSNLITLSAKMRKRAVQASQISSDERCGVILAAGRGTRLAPLTLYANKHELPVGGVPMIFRPLFTLRSMGVTDVLVVLDRENAPDRFIAMLGNGSEFGMSITYRIQQGAGGIAAALMLADRFVNNRECYVILGDNIFDEDEFEGWESPDWNKEFGCSQIACVFYKAVPNPKDYGIILHGSKNRVSKIIEKPSNPPTNLAVVGLYIYPPSVFEIIPTLTPSRRDELEITDVNNYFGESNQLASREITGFWGDAGGSIDLFLRVNEHVIRSQS